MDDDPDIIFTFKKVFEDANRIGGRISFHVNTYNDHYLIPPHKVEVVLNGKGNLINEFTATIVDS